jgi:hypothetical protein
MQHLDNYWTKGRSEKGVADVTYRVANAQETVVVHHALRHAGNRARNSNAWVQAGDDGSGHHGGRRHNGHGQLGLVLGGLLGRARHCDEADQKWNCTAGGGEAAEGASFWKNSPGAGRFCARLAVCVGLQSLELEAF